MRDLPRIAFLLAMNAMMFVLLAMLLDGCVVSPRQLRYQHGDFVGNIAVQTGAEVSEHATTV